MREGRVLRVHGARRTAPGRALAGSYVSLSGGYGPHYDRLAVTRLNADHARLSDEYRIVLPTGEARKIGLVDMARVTL